MSSHAFQTWLEERVDPELARPTRIHPLPSLAPRVYAKREDELSAGISGSKLRKFASLIPYLKNAQIKRVAALGGPNSNNLVGLLQILKENAIEADLFVRQASDQNRSGNALFMELLASPKSIHPIPREEWPAAQNIATDHLKALEDSSGPTYLIPEGSLCSPCLAGACTLAMDILRNESEGPPGGLYFPSIYIDSGSGMSAIGLILGLALADANCSQRTVYVTLIAGTPEEFRGTLQRFQGQLEAELSCSIEALPQIHFLTPPTARSYGAVNASVLEACREIARTEGLLMDPVYSAKHYLAMQEHLRQQDGDPSAPALFVFNGSPLGLAGFQDRI